MAEEEPDVIDAVTEATNGIGSEALAAITNLGGGSGQAASSVLSRLGATISGRTGGFAPKVITTVTRHGLAAIDRVEPIQDVDENRRFSSANQKSPISDDVDRGYRAIARDANGLESIRTVLDLDPREYDVTVTREDGVAIVEFVQQEPEPDAALPPGDGDDGTETAASGSEPTTTVEEPGSPDRRSRAPAPNRVERGASTRVQPAVEPTAQPVAHDEEVQRARAESEKAKAEAEAEKARAEAEKAKAEAEAAKARAEAERARAEADVEAVRSGQSWDATRASESGVDRDTAERQAPAGAAESRGERESAADDGTGSSFSAARDLDAGFDSGAAGGGAAETAGSWGLDDGGETVTGGGGERGNAAGDRADDATGDGFGEFTPATPVEDEPTEYADGGAIETSISVHDEGATQGAVADGGIDGDEDTGEFQF